MKVLKITSAVEIEIIAPVGDISQEEIDELHSEKGQQDFHDGALKDANEQAKANGGKVISMKVKAEIIEV